MRISLVVAARLKLKRIYKNANGDLAMFAGGLARHPDQLPVRLVQRAHRRHEHTPFCMRLRLCVCDGGQNFHTASSFTHLPLELISINGSVMLSGALQRNAKDEARLSNISDLFRLRE